MDTLRTTLRRLARLTLALALVLGLLLGFAPTARAASLTVTNTNNAGPGSLRQAIADAASGDKITFNLAGCPCTITLADELYISKNLTIAGPGAKVLTVSGNNAVAIFHVAEGTFNVTLSGMTMANALSSEGGIYVESNGTFNLINVAVLNNKTRDQFGQGGGLNFYNNQGGTVTITGSTFSGNFAAEGGAIHLQNGNVRISNTTISGNTVYSRLSPYGGGISNYNSDLTIINSTITANSTTAAPGAFDPSSGGVSSVGGGSITISNSLIAGNSGDYPDVWDNSYASGTIISLGNNLIGTNQGAGASFPAGTPMPKATSSAPRPRRSTRCWLCWPTMADRLKPTPC